MGTIMQTYDDTFTRKELLRLREEEAERMRLQWKTEDKKSK
jgi:hypothetical protein